MRKYLIIILLVTTLNSFSQTLDYCNYFGLEVTESEFSGKNSKSFAPIAIKKGNDKFNEFLDAHFNRYSYIFFKYINNYQKLANYFPDTNRIRNEFCTAVLKSAEIQKYFKSITPKNWVKWSKNREIFTTKELMLAASKFFYCDAVRENDTVIQSYICVGINGQNEFKSTIDLTILEAFSFEAIFFYMLKDGDPLFVKDFQLVKNNIENTEKRNFKDFNSYLLQVRKQCYLAMEKNVDLKKKLLKYYKRNKRNLNLKIK
jgi:hypothetical protein